MDSPEERSALSRAQTLEVPLYGRASLGTKLSSSGCSNYDLYGFYRGAVKCILRLKMHYKSTDQEGAGLGLHRASRHVWPFSQVETRGELSVHAFGDDSTCVTEGDG
jgi:hypothetical protein